jgi:predicted membrane protein
MKMRLTPQAVLGALIVVFGLLLTADNFRLLDADKVLRFWPMVFIAVGLTKLVQSDTGSGQVFGGFLASIGVLMIADEFWDVHLDVGRLWPLALVAIGAFIVYRAARGESACGPAGVTTSDNQVSEFAFWSGKARKIASPGFRRADLTAVMGGVEIDLRGASTPPGQDAIIDVFVWWGGVEITVPPDWAVSNQIVAIMGGAEDSSTGTQASTNRLIVRGFCIMGGVDIKTAGGVASKQW